MQLLKQCAAFTACIRECAPTAVAGYRLAHPLPASALLPGALCTAWVRSRRLSVWILACAYLLARFPACSLVHIRRDGKGRAAAQAEQQDGADGSARQRHEVGDRPRAVDLVAAQLYRRRLPVRVPSR